MLRFTASIAAMLLGTALLGASLPASAQDRAQVSIDACSNTPITMNVDVRSPQPVDINVDVGSCELSLAGRWEITQECILDWGGIWELGPTQYGEFRGIAQFLDGTHRLSGYVLGEYFDGIVGVEINDTYRDIFGRVVSETYIGALSPDGQMIEGYVTDGWHGHCNFIAWKY